MGFLQRIIPGFTWRRFAHAAAVVGAVSLLIALVFYLSESELSTLGFAFLVLGMAGVSVWLLLAPDELRDWLTGRQVYYGTGTVILIVVVIAMAVVGYSVALSQNVVVDLTETQNYSISQPSINVLNDLEGRLDLLEADAAAAGVETDFHFRLVGFYTRQQLRDQKSAEFLLRQYVEASSDDRVRLEFYDPDVDPLIARSYGYSLTFDNTQLTSGPVYLALYDGDQRLALENVGVPTERTVQNAMLRISLIGEFKVYFIEGQLEYDINVDSDIGLSGAAFLLTQRGIIVETLRLADVEAIPADATAIVIPGAQAPYSQTQIDKIDAYIERGGRMLVLADPPYVDTRPDVADTFTNQFLLEDSNFNNYLWDTFGVRFRDNAVVDPASSSRSEFVLTGLRVNTGSPPVRDFQNTVLVMAFARSLDIIEAPQPDTPPADYVQSVMILGATSAYGERSIQEVDLGNLSEYDPAVDDGGDQVVGVAVYRRNEVEQDAQPRVILIGDTDWMTNAFILPEDGSEGVLGNILLWAGIVEWLTGFSEFAEIDVASRPDLLPLYATSDELAQIQVLTLLVLPGVVLLCGVVVWVIRQRV